METLARGFVAEKKPGFLEKPGFFVRTAILAKQQSIRSNIHVVASPASVGHTPSMRRPPFMTEPTTPAQRRIFTIGHSNHEEQAFLDLLQRHEIEVVADVRSQPYSKYTTQFNSDQIKQALAGAGINYVFLGRELGGRPDGPEFYDAENHVRYDRVAESPLFRQGIERLETGIRKFRVALMCSEENPAECHRNLLVGRVLGQRGVELVHIRGDGRLQTQAELNRESGQSDHRQKLLLPELEEQPWRSIRSVSPKPLPPNSSES